MTHTDTAMISDGALLFDTPAAWYVQEAARTAELDARCAEWDAFLAGTGPKPASRVSALPPRYTYLTHAW